MSSDPRTAFAEPRRLDMSEWRTMMVMDNDRFTDGKKAIFLEALAFHGQVNKAALSAGIGTTTAYAHRKADEDFSRAWAWAIDHYRESVADEVRRRGRDGWLEPVYSNGVRAQEHVRDSAGRYAYQHPETLQIEYFATELEAQEKGYGVRVTAPAVVRKFSDRMLELEAKRAEPGYREKSQVDLGGAIGGVLVAPPSTTPDQWVRDQQRSNEERDDPRKDPEAIGVSTPPEG